MSESKATGNSIAKIATTIGCGVLCYIGYKILTQNDVISSLKIPSKWKGKNIETIKSFKRNNIEELFELSLKMEDIVLKYGKCNIARNKILGLLFYEPSTRTCSSFEAAMYRLGGSVIKINNIKMSSVKKGETLSDTIKCIQCYTDGIVLRHPNKGAINSLSHICNDKPIINGGDGDGEHPTQALLDMFTMYKELGCLDDINITFIGDLKYGRTVHSLVPALSLFRNITFNFVSPNILQIPKYIMDKLRDTGHNINVFQELNDDLLGNTDVMYVTRIQKERFKDVNEYEKVKSCYVINKKLLTKCKGNMIIMHPLPRVNEISTDVDDDKRAKYFVQMKYGMYVRMALISMVLGL